MSSNQVDNCLYQLVLYANVHHELTTLHVYPVALLDVTGQHTLEQIIAKIATDMDFQVTALIPIYESYYAADVAAGHSASKLRDAIRSRLIEKQLFDVVTDIALDENESVVIDSDSDA